MKFPKYNLFELIVFYMQLMINIPNDHVQCSESFAGNLSIIISLTKKGKESNVIIE